MSWLSSLFVKQKPKQKQWSVCKVSISRINCVNCDKPFKDNQMAWVSPSGRLVQHTDCVDPGHIPDEFCDKNGRLKE